MPFDCAEPHIVVRCYRYAGHSVGQALEVNLDRVLRVLPFIPVRLIVLIAFGRFVARLQFSLVARFLDGDLVALGR